MNSSSSPRDGPIRVTFFGDSTCVGQGVSIYRGWVTKIAQFLDEYGQAIGKDFLVSNASINGRTTRQALEDMPYHVQNHGVDILVVQFGLNDCNYWASDRGLPRVSLPAFVANLREIVARGRNFGAFRVLLNSNHPTSRNRDPMPGTSITYEDSNRAYNQAIRDVAEAMVPLVVFQDIERHFADLMSKRVSLESLLLQDGLHLSVAGHDAYFRIMRNAIQAAVDDLVAEKMNVDARSERADQ